MKINARLKDELKKHLLQSLREEESRVTITSSYSLTAEEKKRIVDEIVPGATEVAVVVDPSIIAGVIVRRGSKIIDLSLQSMLQNLQKQAL